MPLLEAPTEYTESSPEHSLQPEIPIFLAPLPGPAALAQLRPPPPEIRLQQQQQQQQLVERQNRRGLGRRNSYDRDIPTAEENEHFPAFVHLLPVVLPPQLPEPTLDELLVSREPISHFYCNFILGHIIIILFLKVEAKNSKM